MHHSTRVVRRARACTVRTAAAIIAAAILALLAAACSGNPSSAGSGGSPSAVAYSACMRSHGVPNFPDPKFDSQGRLGFMGPGADNPPGSPTDHAVNQCHHLLPAVVTALGPPS